ncbi:MAG: hypothetical protein F2664_01025 [Actinobacteria bacterium]|uniref:Unannotated protein n=1 Tax=freshwater metagenome TaxID=449393 RepID=A0A6J6M0J3_9ZZZZ|nr:hypothetical protein [Actinomycetota bacterium]MSY86958.1 hypothetical protein [Actinomycetota bacterium]MTA50570.1 hypothetical protein [Actinomycetota bacterium]
MQSTNPVLKQSRYATFDSAAQVTGSSRMSIDDVVTRTGILLAVLLLAAVATYVAPLTGVLFFGALIIGFVLCIVNSVSKTVRPALMVLYSVFEGLVIGTISRVYNDYYSGIVTQAVIGTVAAFVGILFLYKSGKLRATPKFTRILLGAVAGYFVLGLISLVASFFNVGNGMGFYGVTGLGLLMSVAGVALASLFLVLDFDQIERSIAQGAPAIEAWRSGFGLIVTLVWIYLEILRLLSILRDR